MSGACEIGATKEAAEVLRLALLALMQGRERREFIAARFREEEAAEERAVARAEAGLNEACRRFSRAVKAGEWNG